MFGFGFNIGVNDNGGGFLNPYYLTPPIVTSPDDPIVEGSTLNVSDGTWANIYPPITFTYQWYKNGVAIGGATTNSYVIIDQGSYYAIVTATNSLAKSTPAKSNTVSVGVFDMITEDSLFNMETEDGLFTMITD